MQKVSVSIRPCNRNCSREKLGQNIFVEREESTGIILRSMIKFIFFEFPFLNGKDPFPADILPNHNSIRLFATKKYCVHSCNYLDLKRISA